MKTHRKTDPLHFVAKESVARAVRDFVQGTRSADWQSRAAQDAVYNAAKQEAMDALRQELINISREKGRRITAARRFEIDKMVNDPASADAISIIAALKLITLKGV